MATLSFLSKGVKIQVNSGTEFLELYRKNPQVPLKFGCTRGDCGTCAIKVHSGMENLTQKSSQEKLTLKYTGHPEENYRLACQCAINGDVVLE